MTRIHGLFLFLLAAPLFAQPVTVIRFDPPDPTPRTAVTAHVHVPNAGCGATGAIVSRAGQNINIALQLALIQCIVPAPGDVTVDLGILPAGVYTVGVSPGNLLSLIGEQELAVREATPPLDVRPNTHTEHGDVIRLTAKGIGTPSAVRFGTAAAEIVSVSPDEIVVREPVGLAPGTYDVTIERPGVPLTAIAAFNVPKAAPSMVNESFYERVLLPVFWSGPGAFGAQWETEATLYNANEYTINAAHVSNLHNFCPFLCDGRPAARSTTTVTAGPSTIAGVVEELPRQALANTDFGLVIRDTSRADKDLGTQIPVVRDSQLFARTFSIPNVPSDPRYRLTLRMYDIDGAATFTLRVYTRVGSAPAVTDGIALNGGFAIINDLIAKYPQLAGFGPLRVEIDPLARDGARSAWGFITVTNNETQHVIVLSPQ